jgi:hypothetical protein
MSVTGAVQWWEEWQLRVLVLCSLAIQCLLLLFSFMRRYAIPGWVRFMMWLAYLAGDAVAIYALATLFNRRKTDEHGGSTLEVVWAPVLLLHLGGHDGFTAYNIEDNELWSRHLLTAVSQVTVAIYVFCKSWPPSGDKRVLQAAILLFVPGVFKCFVKPWALKSASIYSLVSSPAASLKQNEDETYLLEDYVKQAKHFVQKQNGEGEAQVAMASVDGEDNEVPGKLFLDRTVRTAHTLHASLYILSFVYIYN